VPGYRSAPGLLPKTITTMTSEKPIRKKINSPFGRYFRSLEEIDKDLKNSNEFGSILILSLVEEIGEMSRAYLAKHGRKPTNKAAQNDETYQQELGDILVTIIRFARIKNIDLDKRIKYTLAKIKRRKTAPKL
jgi:NTP pyrophosphatase (non-canonical NTP hydrolase)